jgi:hypothetical protein
MLTGMRTDEIGQEGPSRGSMAVRGSFFAGRKAFIIHQFGEARWARFLAKLSEREPIFREQILVTMRVPMSAYIAFQDAIIHDFFGGKEEAYFAIGEASAKWALTEGPYRSYRNNPQSHKKFILQSLPLLWSAYHTKGKAELSLNENVVRLRIHGIPVRHISLEYTVIGYVKMALHLIGLRKITAKRIQGFSAGNREIEYEFSFAPPAAPLPC